MDLSLQIGKILNRKAKEKGEHTMVKQYQKGAIVQLSVNFWLHEFDCHCQRPECQTTLVDMNLVRALEELRTKVHLVHLDCGYRCPAHNREVGGVAHSQHVEGKAADIKTPLGTQATKAQAESIPAFQNGGIGLYPHFVHVDVRGHKARWDNTVGH